MSNDSTPISTQLSKATTSPSTVLHTVARAMQGTIREHAKLVHRWLINEVTKADFNGLVHKEDGRAHCTVATATVQIEHRNGEKTSLQRRRIVGVGVTMHSGQVAKCYHSPNGGVGIAAVTTSVMRADEPGVSENTIRPFVENGREVCRKKGSGCVLLTLIRKVLD